MEPKNQKVMKMNPETKAILALLISQIQKELDSDNPCPPESSFGKLSNIDKTLKRWVSANDLHPEKVTTISMEEGLKLIRDSIGRE